jgi:hypothetical protein
MINGHSNKERDCEIYMKEENDGLKQESSRVEYELRILGNLQTRGQRDHRLRITRVSGALEHYTKEENQQS